MRPIASTPARRSSSGRSTDAVTTQPESAPSASSMAPACTTQLMGRTLAAARRTAPAAVAGRPRRPLVLAARLVRGEARGGPLVVQLQVAGDHAHVLCLVVH